ncbi:hypothetical protein K2173_001070 [Erythroxylum novogranatense]|uniref:Small ribosomal subunit protein mS38 n=1 Tax=Erythroxylum novogranatense TaxID=1862640 RepID=A0AAV8SJ82_9ROSI|nr:hypothetical protein K2173_001070 [Erythroxylum novogranatense]
MANPILNFIKRTSTSSSQSLRIIGTTLRPWQLNPPIKSQPDNFPEYLLNHAIINSHKPTKVYQYSYPSFPFGSYLNPIHATGFDLNDDIEGDDARTVWADSVKKKRKKKMNKHKYKKLRKRLRRKSH